MLVSTYAVSSQVTENPLSEQERQKIIDSLSFLPLKQTQINFDDEVFFQSVSRSVNDGCSGGDFEIAPISVSVFPPQVISQEWNLIDLINYGGSSSFLGGGLMNNNSGLLYTTDSSNSNHIQGQTYIQWTSSAYRDQTLASANPPFTLPMAYNTGRAVRLGNNHSNDNGSFGRAEGISKTFVVNQSNKIYYFKYAIVGQFSHGKTDSAFFMAEAINSAGLTIDSYFENGVQNNPFISITRNSSRYHQGYTKDDRFFYRDWTCASLDLRDYIGQQVTVRFVNSDCAQGGHTAHSYIDDVCVPCKDTEGWIKINNKECLFLPGEINGEFYTPINQPSIRNISIKILFYQNNILKHTFIPTIVGSTYSLNLTDNMLENLDCYDIVSQLSFELQDGYNPTQYINYTKLSTTSLNNSIEGQVEGVNNDICFNCATPFPNCCQTPLKITKETLSPIANVANGAGWSVGIPLSLATDEFTINNNSSIPITELRAVVTDIDFEYNLDACAVCIDNPAYWGSIDNGVQTIGDSNNGLDIVDYQGSILVDRLNQREVVWKNPKGTLLKQGDTFKLAYAFPPFSDIPCCVTTVKVCTEISWKDANCNLCTQPFCSTFILNE